MNPTRPARRSRPEPPAATPPTTSIRPSRTAIIRAPGLLPMRYTPSELADELGLTAPAIRDWLGRGLPHERDAHGRLWINGVAFAAWLDQARRAGRPKSLAENEAYCLKCRRAVAPDAAVRRANGPATLLSGRCPHCGTAVFRGAPRG